MDADNTSKNVPRASLGVKSIQQINDATQNIPEIESRQQRMAPNVMTLKKNREGSASSCVPTTHKVRVLELFVDTNAEPEHHVATLAQQHTDKLFHKVIKQQA